MCLDWNLPWAKWFVGGKTNISYNCLDRHVHNGKRDKTAILWEGEPGEVRKLSYGELLAEVQKFANALKSLGIRKGDRVAVYMGMTPELAIAILACARIGAIHSVIFGGFAVNAIVDRVNDAQCVAILTQDTSYRRGNEVKLKATVDEAVVNCPTVKNVVVYKRSGSPIQMSPAETTGGMIWSQLHPRIALPRNWTQKIRYTSFTPPAPPASQRGWYIRPAATPSRPI